MIHFLSSLSISLEPFSILLFLLYPRPTFEYVMHVTLNVCLLSCPFFLPSHISSKTPKTHTSDGVYLFFAWTLSLSLLAFVIIIIVNLFPQALIAQHLHSLFSHPLSSLLIALLIITWRSSSFFPNHQPWDRSFLFSSLFPELFESTSLLSIRYILPWNRWQNFFCLWAKSSYHLTDRFPHAVWANLTLLRMITISLALLPFFSYSPFSPCPMKPKTLLTQNKIMKSAIMHSFLHSSKGGKEFSYISVFFISIICEKLFKEKREVYVLERMGRESGKRENDIHNFFGGIFLNEKKTNERNISFLESSSKWDGSSLCLLRFCCSSFSLSRFLT